MYVYSRVLRIKTWLEIKNEIFLLELFPFEYVSIVDAVIVHIHEKFKIDFIICLEL